VENRGEKIIKHSKKNFKKIRNIHKIRMHHTFFPFGYSFVVVEACWGKHAREAKAT